ncbi:MAG: segregation/condensation protein A [Spirochaetaceae bacterium]|nr:segregation/condensation protein A [Spirochaetaceae bacterium]
MKSLSEVNAMSAEIVAKRAIYQTLKFENPLALLYFLIKHNDMNIYDIPIAEITDQFLEYLDYAVDPDLETLSDFYAMAANLLYIKARMLLPNPKDAAVEEIEDPRSELVEKLIEYQKFKKLSELMEQTEDAAAWSLERKKSHRILPFDDETVWETADSWNLLNLFTQIASSYDTMGVYDNFEEVTVNEKTALMFELFETRGECFFTDLIVRKNSVMDVVCAFMALLEAVKFDRARIFQNKMYADIKICPVKE